MWCWSAVAGRQTVRPENGKDQKIIDGPLACPIVQRFRSANVRAVDATGTRHAVEAPDESVGAIYPGPDPGGAGEGENAGANAAAIDRFGFQGVRQWCTGNKYAPLDQVLEAGNPTGCGHQGLGAALMVADPQDRRRVAVPRPSGRQTGAQNHAGRDRGRHIETQ